MSAPSYPPTLVPAEWAPQHAIWTCWPSDPGLWEDDLAAARAEVAAMVGALSRPAIGGDGINRHGTPVHILAANSAAAESARSALAGLATVHEVPFGDVWLRDTGPIFDSQSVAHRFEFNGWGGKYQLPGDKTVGVEVARLAGAPVRSHPLTLEGGAVDHDGLGSVLTTRQCLLNPNRNPGWDEPAVETALAQSLGAAKVIWLADGLLNDHTDGHVDNVARFIAPGIVACQAPFGADDPNRDVLLAIADQLADCRDALGRALKVVTLPSPGLVMDVDGNVVPASHMNFIIGNSVVVMPHYGTASADEAARALAAAFPQRRVVAIRSSALLTGGGSFHCITQQQPSLS